MRSVYAKVLAAGAIVLAASPAFAQPPRPGGPGGFGGMMQQAPSIEMLLRNDKVQEELKLTDDQKAGIKKATDTVSAKYKDDMDKARADRDFPKMGELRKSMSADLEKALADVLKPEQTKRVKQIQVQNAGLAAFSMDDVQTALKLTDKQKDDVKQEGKDLQDDIRDLMQGAQGDREKMADAMKKVQALRTDTLSKIVDGLSDDQKKTWKDLTGDKFAVALGGPGGFGPGGFGGGFGPGGPGGGAFGPGGGPGRAFGVGGLLRNDKVQEELKLTDDQKSDVQKAGDTVRAKYKDDMDKARADMDFAKMGELQKSQNEDLEKALAGVLKADQSKRLKQIQVQAAGLAAFSLDDVQSALKLTDAQKKEIKDAAEGLQKDTQDAFQGAQGDREKMADAMKKVQTLRSDAMDKIVKGLTDDQKKTWKDLTGDKFELSFGPPGGRPGRPNPNQ